MSTDSTTKPAYPSRNDSRVVDAEIPVWWTFKKGSYLTFIYGLLCVIGTGHTSLVPIWRVVHPNCTTEDWKEVRDSMKQRFEHINILVRLCEI